MKPLLITAVLPIFFSCQPVKESSAAEGTSSELSNQTEQVSAKKAQEAGDPSTAVSVDAQGNETVQADPPAAETKSAAVDSASSASTAGADPAMKNDKMEAANDPKSLLLKKLQGEFEKPSDEALRGELSEIQYEVTQHEGTERAFTNEYWDNKTEGLYVDRVSGIPLFSSSTKYKSGTGWPSFFAPIHDEEIVLVEDRKLFYTRVEVRSKTADSHLGHVFDDGPEPTGKRYCMNSAALKFVPKEELEKEGLSAYLDLFEK